MIENVIRNRKFSFINNKYILDCELLRIPKDSVEFKDL